MSHIAHPDTLEHGLHDACPDCQAKAKDPVARLDGAHVRDLWLRMVAVEHGSSRANLPQPYSDVGRYRTDLEAEACRHLYRIAVFLERHSSVWPWTWPLVGENA